MTFEGPQNPRRRGTTSFDLVLAGVLEPENAVIAYGGCGKRVEADDGQDRESLSAKLQTLYHSSHIDELSRSVLRSSYPAVWTYK